MHTMPLSYSSIYVFLKLAGFENIKIHDVDEKKPKHLFEKFFGWPQKKYCRENQLAPVQKKKKSFGKTWFCSIFIWKTASCECN